MNFNFLFSEDIVLQSKDYYLNGFYEIANHNFQNANEEFLKIQKHHPFSEENKNSIILECFLSYVLQEYEKIDGIVDAFKILYPYDSKLRYLLYIKALGYYKQINDENNSKDLMLLSITIFDSIINKYPESDIYVIKSKEKKSEIFQLIIKNEILIADFYYQQQDVISAAKRYSNILEEYKDKIGEDKKQYIIKQLNKIENFLIR